MGVTLSSRIRQDDSRKIAMIRVVDASAIAALLFAALLFNEVAARWVRDETSDCRRAV
ncbi:MAG TPA: hypothetical protein VMQ99_24235 [Acetobacteraceae bacterium]|jgi:hypothetical protein|nr:hypothetical protein [Acetobacteraceae bacterium]